MLFTLPSLADVFAAVEGLYAAYGYPLVLVAALLENTILLGVFFPGGTVVVLAGVYARLGHLSVPLVIAVGTLGTFLGASLDYWLARRGLNGLLQRHIAGRSLERSLSWLRRYGFWAVLAAHFIGHLRSMIAVAAGLLPVPYRRFALWELPAAFAWNVLYVMLGYVLADNFPLIERYLGWIARGVGALVALFVLWRAWVWWARRARVVGEEV